MNQTSHKTTSEMHLRTRRPIDDSSDGSIQMIDIGPDLMIGAKNRLKRALAALAERCRKNLHAPIKEQHQKLTEKLRGHYGYYGPP
jgi:hypothetical protein